ncbi:MAG: DNA-binding transcriptional repressor FabR [Methanocella sp. PtaU1.Bin125]|nr:MAG: DNA-binding transcriptional repressor FabR [Methanocella sp. PtaU1.Bin125]
MLVTTVSIKELKEREKEQRREYIIDAAEKLFFARGYDSVSMSEIAYAVGMNKATLYLYFENKDALYFAIVRRGVRIMHGLFREKIEKAATSIEKIRASGDAFLEFNRQYPHYYRMFRHAGSGRFDAPGSADAAEVARLSGDIFAMMGRAVVTGMADGTIRKGLDPTVVAIYLAVASEAVVNLPSNFVDTLASQGISHEQFIESTMELMQSSIATQPQTKKSD